MTLEEKWQKYEADIKNIQDLKDKLYEQKRKCEKNIDHSYSNNKWVKMYLGETEIEPITSLEEFEQFMNEGASYITDCVVDIFFEKNGYESDSEEEQDEQREWMSETLWYNVVQMFCSASYDNIDYFIDDVQTQQFYDCVYDKWSAEYENAEADLYFGYGFQTWYDHHKDSFESEEEAKFVWTIATVRMTNAYD